MFFLVSLRVFEVWLTARLIASPTFNRGVRQVHKKVFELRHGPIEGEGGGTNIDRPAGSPSFLKHFVDELKGEFVSTKKR